MTVDISSERTCVTGRALNWELGSRHWCGPALSTPQPGWAAHLPGPWSPPAAETTRVTRADSRDSVVLHLPDAPGGCPSVLLLPWSLVATSLPSRTPAPGPLRGSVCHPPRAALRNLWTARGAHVLPAVASTLGQARVLSGAVLRKLG